MLYIAVVDIKDSFSAVAVYSEGWSSRELLGVQICRGSFLDRAEGSALKVKEAIERLSPEEPTVILLLPRSLVHVTHADIPAKNETVLRKMMEFEVTRHFPIPHDELIYDYVMDEVPAKGRGNYFVNIAGLKRSDFEEYMKAAAESGLNPAEVSYSSVAWLTPPAEGGWPDDDEKAQTGKRCFIEIMPEGFEMSMVDGSSIIYSRFSRFRPKVEEKYFYSEEPTLDSPAFRIANQLSQELDHIRLVSGMVDVEDYIKKVFLAGGSVLRKSIGSRLAQNMAFSESEIRYLPDDDNGTGFDYAAIATGALGIAQIGRRFNFMHGGHRPARGEEARRKLTVAGYAVAALLFVWVAIGYGTEWRMAADLEQRLADLKSRVSGIEEASMRMVEYRVYLDSFNSVAGKPSLTVGMLDGLTRALPRDTYLTDIELRGGEIKISGISRDASALLEIMEGTDRFKSARMVGAVKAAGSGEKFRIGMEFE